jgi:hypothetical protein
MCCDSWLQKAWSWPCSAALLACSSCIGRVLRIAAGLLLTSFARLQRVEPGFEPDGVFTAQVVLPPQRYDRDKLVAFYEQSNRVTGHQA